MKFTYKDLDCTDARERQKILDAAHRRDTYEVTMIGLDHERLARWAERPNSYQIGTFDDRGKLLMFSDLSDRRDPKVIRPDDGAPFYGVFAFWPTDVDLARECFEQGVKALYERFKRTAFFDVMNDTYRKERATPEEIRGADEILEWNERIGYGDLAPSRAGVSVDGPGRIVTTKYRPPSEKPDLDPDREVLPPGKREPPKPRVTDTRTPDPREPIR